MKSLKTLKIKPEDVAERLCSVIDNGLLENSGSGAVAWSARALLAGCGLAARLALPRAAAGAARGAVGAYSRRGGLASYVAKYEAKGGESCQ